MRDGTVAACLGRRQKSRWIVYQHYANTSVYVELTIHFGGFCSEHMHQLGGNCSSPLEFRKVLRSCVCAVIPADVGIREIFAKVPDEALTCSLAKFSLDSCVEKAE